MCSNVICGYSCVFVCTACALMLRVAITVCLCLQRGSNGICGYNCVFVCTACALMLCVCIAVCMCAAFSVMLCLIRIGNII